MKIRVVYDTKNGSTTDVAQAIGTRLREQGCTVEVQPARAVRKPDDCDALVVGAPIYSGRWLSGAHRMLRKVSKRNPEQRPPLAIFALGPRRDEGPENWERPKEQFDRALAKHPDLIPVATALFGGADPPKKSPRRDIRNWDAIRSWADELAALFGCL